MRQQDRQKRGRMEEVIGNERRLNEFITEEGGRLKGEGTDRLGCDRIGR